MVLRYEKRIISIDSQRKLRRIAWADFHVEEFLHARSASVTKTPFYHRLTPSFELGIKKVHTCWGTEDLI